MAPIIPIYWLHLQQEAKLLLYRKAQRYGYGRVTWHK